MKKIEPLEAYHAELKRAGTVRDHKILAAKVAYNIAAEKAFEKRRAAEGQ